MPSSRQPGTSSVHQSVPKCAEVARAALDIDRALAVRRRVLAVADVVIARQEAHRQVEPVMQRARRREIALVRRTVERDVARVEHEVGPVGAQRLADAHEIVDEERLVAAEMGVGDLGDAEGHAGKPNPAMFQKRDLEEFLPTRERGEVAPSYGDTDRGVGEEIVLLSSEVDALPTLADDRRPDGLVAEENLELHRHVGYASNRTKSPRSLRVSVLVRYGCTSRRAGCSRLCRSSSSVDAMDCIETAQQRRGYRMEGACTHAMWSCVANPVRGQHPRYVLPIGFVQSPLLASLVLYQLAR